MGKKKFEKNKGVTFKLVFRSEDDQANADQTLSERIFSVIEADKKKADQENDKERQKILSQFTKEELGQAPAKKAKPHHGAIKASAPPTNAVSSQSKGRDDLWITHLMKMKEQAKAQAEAEEAEEEEEEERRQALLKKGKQPVKKAAAKKGEEEEDEEWEDDEDGDEEWEDEEEEDDDEEEEYEEIEEEDEEEEEEQEPKEEVKLFKKKAAVEDEEQGNKNVLEKIEEVDNEKANKLVVTDEDFPQLGADGPSKPHRFVEEKEKTKDQVLEEMAEEEIDLKKVNVKGAVRMKRYDDMGLPMDGYNYYQHVVDANSGGAPSFAFTTTYDKVQKLPEDLDIKKEKMNAEEKEVYEALELEGEGGYEDLEDDFFTSLTKAEAVVVEEGNQNKDGKKVTFGDNDIKEILSSKDDPKKAAAPAPAKDGIYSRKDFQKVLKQQVEVLKEKYKEERQKNKAKYNMPESDEEEEEEEVEEVDESWDEDDEENRPKGYIERVKWEDDFAAQQCVAKSMSSLDSEEDGEERRTRASKAATTRANSEIFPQPAVRQTKLNIVKEQTTNRRKTKGRKDAENKEVKEEKESDSEGEGEEEEEEEEGKNKVEEVFKKREKGETKEEKKQRKEAIKQFKQERKEKKKKFKENFESKKKEHITMAHKQSNSLQGLSIYKLSV